MAELNSEAQDRDHAWFWRLPTGILGPTNNGSA